MLERGITLAVALSVVVLVVGCGSNEQGQPHSGEQNSIEFSASPATVPAGTSASLSWTGHNATSCHASGGWTGEQPAAGGFRTPPLTATTTYTLSCTGARSGSIAHVTVHVDSGTAGGSAPQVSLRSQHGSIAASGSTVLEWNAAGAHTCTASGGWSGAKPSRGSQRISGLTSDATYTLTCEGPDGTGIAMTEVMLQRATLRWSGSANASNHTAFRILWGKRADQPEHQITITNPKLRARAIDLPGAGTYYFILATLDGKNKEISRSNTASKLLPP